MSAETQNEMKRLRRERDQARDERDFLIAEYERAVGCGPQGFAHAAGHLFNTITNAKADINTKHFLFLRDERDALAAHVEALTRELTACQSVLHQLARNGEVTPAYADDAKAVLKQAPETSLARLKAQWQAEAAESLLAFRSAVTGWRENDWPEWFCRRTAEAVADRGRQAEGGEA